MSPATVSEFMTTSISSFLLEESPDAIVAMTPEDMLMVWSKGAETILERIRAKAVGRSIVPPDRVSEEPGTGSVIYRRGVSNEMAGVFPVWLFSTDSERPSTGSRSSPRDSRFLQDALTDVSSASGPPSRFFSRSSGVSRPLQTGPVRHPKGVGPGTRRIGNGLASPQRDAPSGGSQ
jgi:hypothetical protein